MPLDLRRSPLLGDGAGDDRLSYIGGVGDLDPAGLGFLGDWDGQGEHTVLVGGADAVTVEAFPEEHLAAELTLGPFGDLDLVALRPHPAAVARTVRRSFSTVNSMKRLSTPGRLKWTVNSLPRR